MPLEKSLLHGPPARVVSLADPYVRCGLRLLVCPTYALDRNEADLPRGRIRIAFALARGLADPTSEPCEYLDPCLDCWLAPARRVTDWIGLPRWKRRLAPHLPPTSPWRQALTLLPDRWPPAAARSSAVAQATTERLALFPAAWPAWRTLPPTRWP